MILVTGGAGYIGSHFVKKLNEFDPEKKIIIIDDFSSGKKKLNEDNLKYINGSYGDRSLLSSVFNEHQIETVVHFAGNSIVSESVKDPAKFYNNNLVNSVNLMDSMIEHDVKKIIFSSTAAVYGDTDDEYIDEDSIENPINPYGKSKYFIEQLIKDYHDAYGLNYIIFRYFNACGAYPSQGIGENHNPETHIIPVVLKKILNPEISNVIEIFGDEYDTYDGTCIRDYIHVLDLASAHIEGLNYMADNEVTKKIYNIGNRKGTSVLEIVKICERITGEKLQVKFLENRKGDPSRLVACNKKILKELNWKPKYSIEQSIKDAWDYYNYKK